MGNEIRIFDTYKLPLYDEDNKIFGLLGTARDITERVRQERDIKLLNRLYSISQVSQAAVQAATPEAFLIETCRVIVEEGGFVLSWIGQVEAETNAVVPVATWGGISDYVRGITVYEDDRPEGRGPTGTCIRERRPSVQNDFLHSPLTQPWSELAQPFGIRAAAGFPIESGGRAWGALTIYSDEIGFFGIENVRLLETVAGDIGFALDKFEGERQRTLAQQEREKLQVQLRQAQKMEAIGTLAGGIAHDFNNMLGIIMGYAELAELGLPPDSALKRGIAEILRTTHRAKDLVKQILTFGRQQEQEWKPLQIVPIIKEALKLLRPSLPTTIEIRQRIEVLQGEDQVLGDPTQIHQILMNLSTNSAHAMGDRGGILEVTLSSVDFSSLVVGKLPELSPGKYLKLTVEDTGQGMDRATLDRIFDPYFTTKGPGEGTGLGLAVVHGIVKNHNGAITVHSELGKGTVFNVYLPQLGSGEISNAEAQTTSPRGNERILLVDDEEQLANAGKKRLEHLGYKVTVTTSSPDALALLRQQPEDFDLVITDYTMPKMTGVDLAKEMMKIRPNIPIILCTGFSDRISENKARDAGIRALAFKPLAMRDIAETVRRVLDQEMK